MATDTQENSGAENSTNAVERDSVYFLEPVVFQVEDRLFKVPKYYFAQKSDIFESMFSIPQPPGADLEGSSESTPLKLERVSRVDFQKLLEVMYPLDATKTLWSTMTKEGWISVLRLAEMWNFKDIRALAIAKLTNESLEPVEQILLARTYMVPQWLRAGYDALATRSDVLSSEEAKRIGYETAVLMFQARERIRKTAWVNYNGGYQPPLHPSSTIETIFEEELRAVEQGYNA